MKKIIILLILFLVAMEGLGWWAYKKSAKQGDVASVEASSAPASQAQAPLPSGVQDAKNNNNANVDQLDAASQQALLGPNVGKFPYVIVEKQGDLTMRTIHMGVRQWAWDPMALTVNYGEKVNLIVHNADVAHSISIPELGVKADISEDGAIVTFMASKKGTFEYFCDTPCGKGHSQMRGKIIVE